MRTVRRFMIMAVLFLMSLLLPACWDRREINDVAFVLGSAIDKEGDQIRTSAQIALPGQLGGSRGGGGGTSGSKAWYIESKVAPTARLTNLEQQKSVSRQLNFSHRRTILFGEEFSKSGISPTLDVLGRIPQNRLSALVLAAKGDAFKILEADTPIEQFPSEMLREMASASMKNPRSVKSVINTLLSQGTDLMLPSVTLVRSNTAEKESFKTIQVNGIAVFSKDKLAGFLEGEEATGVLWAMGEASLPEVTVEAPEGEGKIIVRFPELNVKHTPRMKGDKVNFLTEIMATGQVVENQSNYQLTDRTRVDRLEEKLRDKVRVQVEEGVRRLQELKSDAVGFGNILYNKKPGVWKKYSADWTRHYEEMNVEVKAEIRVESVGAVVKPFGRSEESLK